MKLNLFTIPERSDLPGYFFFSPPLSLMQITKTTRIKAQKEIQKKEIFHVEKSLFTLQSYNLIFQTP